MASAPTANQLKTQLIALLTPVIGTSGTKKTKILDYLPLAYLVRETEDATVLKSPLDTTTLVGGSTTQRINCLMITELGFSQEPPQRDGSRYVDTAGGRNNIERRFGFAYVYQFGAGSEVVFSTNVELIRVTLNDNPKLGFSLTSTAGTAGQGQYIRNHDGLQMQTMLPDHFSGIICHSAEAVLTVRVMEPLG